MSHRKVNSQGSIAFSWEDKPGIAKATHPDLPLHALNPTVTTQSLPLPPPCPSLQSPTPSRNTSLKGLRLRREDPFLAAYKECTKTVRNIGKLASESKKNGGLKVRKIKFSFSCKNSSEVVEDNSVRLSNLPPLPKGKIRSSRQDFIQPLEDLEAWNYGLF
ncbi:hypothetical protein SLE2022_363720 [Rubroshorea leprosula]